MMSERRARGVPGTPAERRCDRCSAPVVFVREVDADRTFCLNAEQVEGGTIIMLGQRAQEVPPGRGLGYTRHTCRSRWEGGA